MVHAAWQLAPSRRHYSQRRADLCAVISCHGCNAAQWQAALECLSRTLNPQWVQLHELLACSIEVEKVSVWVPGTTNGQRPVRGLGGANGRKRCTQAGTTRCTPKVLVPQVKYSSGKAS